MKVLHIAGGTPTSGAGRGVLWLHEALLQHGVQSQVVFQKGDQPFEHVRVFNQTFAETARQSIRSKLDTVPVKVYPGVKGLFSCGLLGNDIRDWPEYQDADIIHLHWINQAMMSARSIGAINKPVVWTLRDMWPVTGGCHYDLGCGKFKSACGHCPILDSHRSTDLSTMLQRHKRKHFKRVGMHLVAISEWMGECARESANFAKGTPVSVIPNCVDTHQYRPIDTAIAREILGLPADRPIVLCGAQSLKSAYKGFSHYLEAMAHVQPSALFVFFGRLEPSVIANMPVESVNLGFVHDTPTLRLAYSAADVFVAPSIQEAFGKTLIESQACGTPVVCFDATGPKDIINHRVDGYKAVFGDSEDMGRGINWALSLSGAEKEHVSNAARANVQQRFSAGTVADQYKRVYESTLSGAVT